MALTDWEEKQFDKIFDQTIHHIKRLKEHDPSFSLENLKSMLEAASIHQGNDWAGRGAVGHVSSEATIAAYQQLIAQWEREEGEGTDSADS